MFIEQEILNPNKRNAQSKPRNTSKKNKTVLTKHGIFVLKLFLMVAAKEFCSYKKMDVLPESYVNSNPYIQKFLKLYA